MPGCADISKGIFMGGGIYLTIPDMPGCVDITESICVGGGIYLTIPDMPGCIDITEGICVSCGVYFTIPNMSEGEENFVGDSEIIALGGASNETKDRPLG